MKSDTIPIGAIKDENDKPETIAHLRGYIKTQGRQIKQLQAKIGARDEFAKQVAGAVVAASPFPRWKYREAKEHSKPVDAAIMLSDLHIGERVNSREIEGFNRFNYKIAEKRLFSITESFLQWVQVQRQVYSIGTCHILSLGDNVAGDIHDELRVTAEFPLPVQTAKAGLLLGEAVRRIAQHFSTVIVHFVGADNHGRLTKKPQCKQAAENNVNYCVGVIAKERLGSHTNVTFKTPSGIKHLAKINGFKFLVEHGHTVKSHMGIPFYGIERSVGREAKRRMNTNKGFHYWGIGHLHVPGWLAGKTVMNGSLSGTNEYDHSEGRHAEPAQVAFLVHPKHGIFNFTPFHG
jgi:hypothetical protein